MLLFFNDFSYRLVVTYITWTILIGFGCDLQSPLLYSCHLKLKRVIRTPVHVSETVFLHLFRKPKAFLFLKTVKKYVMCYKMCTLFFSINWCLLSESPSGEKLS